VRLRF
jgi:Chaperone of endosialidase